MPEGPRSSEHDLIRRARAQFEARQERRTPIGSRRYAPQLPGYDLIRELHRGGQGVVYQAVQRSTGRDVAVKFLRHGSISTVQEIGRLRREVHILGQLRHPSIVTIHDSGEHDGLVYYIMDYIDGQPLDAYAAGTHLDQRRLAGLFKRVAEAVQAAHLRGVIHRDLKPANILVDHDGNPHILDFGLAKLDDGVTHMTAMTHTGQFIGSLPWSAPEQATGQHDQVDVRTDVYALGVVFWQVLTERFPYAISGDVRSAMHNIINADPSVATDSNTRLTGDLETILRKCLAKEPQRRYQNAGDLAEDLGAFLDNRPISARRDSQLYVLKKSIRRYWAAYLFTLATTVASIVFGGLYVQASRDRAEAESERLAAKRTIDELRIGLHDGVPSLMPFTDDFDGPALDERFLASGQVSLQNGTLVFESSPTGGSSYELNPAQAVIRGDFDASIDFELIDFPVPEAGALHFIVGARSVFTREVIAVAGVHHEHAPEHAPAERCLKGGDVRLSSDRGVRFAEMSAIGGRLRLRRRATTYSAFYWQDGWQHLHSFEGPDEDVRLVVMSGTWFTATPYRVAFDNLEVDTAFPRNAQCLESIHDTFSGQVLDYRFYRDMLFGNLVIERNGHLRFTEQNGDQGYSRVTLDPTRHVLCGDFELSVDYAWIEPPDIEAGEHVIGIEVQTAAERTVVGSIEHVVGPAGTPDVIRADVGDTRARPAPARSGRLRIVRSGSRLSLGYWDDTWIMFEHDASTTDNLTISLFSGATEVASGHVAAFDTLVIDPLISEGVMHEGLDPSTGTP